MRVGLSRGVEFIFIDESSFCSWHIRLRSWTWRTGGDYIFKPISTLSVTSINALTSDGVLYSKLKQGTNSTQDIIDFLSQLELELQSRLDFNSYRSWVVIVFDNATIHKTNWVRNWFDSHQLLALTLPQYTPEWNPIEKAYSILKYTISTQNLHVKWVSITQGSSSL